MLSGLKCVAGAMWFKKMTVDGKKFLNLERMIVGLPSVLRGTSEYGNLHFILSGCLISLFAYLRTLRV